MKKLALVLLLASFALSLSAQNIKFGHINTQELVSLMSERDSAVKQLQAYQKDLMEEMESMQTEFNNKYNTYMQKQATWTDAIKQSKESELQEMSQRIQQFQQTAQQDLAQLEQNLLAPIFEKAKGAIAKIAKEKGLSYVFEISANPLAYYNEAQSLDLLPLAKAALGVPAEKVAPAQIQ
ncbi:MAG: OmpH family outer membrane protein [Bacteroidales bacterium]|nr:OmpH family outer membrane protein [Bacteroidales bacterium]